MRLLALCALILLGVASAQAQFLANGPRSVLLGPACPHCADFPGIPAAVQLGGYELPTGRTISTQPSKWVMANDTRILSPSEATPLAIPNALHDNVAIASSGNVSFSSIDPTTTAYTNFQVGDYIEVAPTGACSNWGTSTFTCPEYMSGTVASYNGTTLTITVTGHAGTVGVFYSPWSIVYHGPSAWSSYSPSSGLYYTSGNWTNWDLRGIAVNWHVTGGWTVTQSYFDFANIENSANGYNIPGAFFFMSVVGTGYSCTFKNNNMDFTTSASIGGIFNGCAADIENNNLVATANDFLDNFSTFTSPTNVVVANNYVVMADSWAGLHGDLIQWTSLELPAGSNVDVHGNTFVQAGGLYTVTITPGAIPATDPAIVTIQSLDCDSGSGPCWTNPYMYYSKTGLNANGVEIYFATAPGATLPTGISTSTTYYAHNSSCNCTHDTPSQGETFNLITSTPNGTPLTVSTPSTGTIYMIRGSGNTFNLQDYVGVWRTPVQIYNNAVVTGNIPTVWPLPGGGKAQGYATFLNHQLLGSITAIASDAGLDRLTQSSGFGMGYKAGDPLNVTGITATGGTTDVNNPWTVAASTAPTTTQLSLAGSSFCGTCTFTLTGGKIEPVSNGIHSFHDNYFTYPLYSSSSGNYPSLPIQINLTAYNLFDANTGSPFALIPNFWGTNGVASSYSINPQCPAPTNLTATTASLSLVMSWTQPTCVATADVSFAAIDYSYTVDGGAAAMFPRASVSCAAGTCSATVTGLTAGSHTIQIGAMNMYNAAWDGTTGVTATTPPYVKANGPHNGSVPLQVGLWASASGTAGP